MKFLKKLNLLDYVIFGAFIIIIFFAVYNFFPNREKTQDFVMYVKSSKIYDAAEGDLCTDYDENIRLGEVSDRTAEGIFIRVKAEKAEQGIDIKGKNYLVGMPVRLRAGDFYIEGEIAEVRLDS